MGLMNRKVSFCCQSKLLLIVQKIYCDHESTALACAALAGPMRSVTLAITALTTVIRFATGTGRLYRLVTTLRYRSPVLNSMPMRCAAFVFGSTTETGFRLEQETQEQYQRDSNIVFMPFQCLKLTNSSL